MESINNIENRLLMSDPEEDMNDLAEASADNADKGDINDDIPINNQTLLRKKQKFKIPMQLNLVILLQ